MSLQPQIENTILDISECLCDLEIRSWSRKSIQLFPFSKQCIYVSLVKTGSEDNTQTLYFGHFKVPM